MKSRFCWDRFGELPIVGIVRGLATSKLVEAVAAARDGGLRNIEVTMNSPDPSEQIRLLVDAMGGKMNVGAGTVRTISELEQARRAGAGFIVSPVINAEVIADAKKRGLAVFPGALTPTEVSIAWEAGADMVKVFPAGVFGPSYIRDLKAPLSEVRLMPTGGIRLEDIAQYRRAGADGFGIGTPLFNRERIAAEDWAWIREQARRFAVAYSSDEQGSASQVGS